MRSLQMSWWELKSITRTLSSLRYKMASVLTSVASLNSRVSTLENASAPPILLLVNSTPVPPDDETVIPDAVLGKLVRLRSSDPIHQTLDLAAANITTAGVVFTFKNANDLGDINVIITDGIIAVAEVAPHETIRVVYTGDGWVPF